MEGPQRGGSGQRGRGGGRGRGGQDGGQRGRGGQDGGHRGRGGQDGGHRGRGGQDGGHRGRGGQDGGQRGRGGQDGGPRGRGGQDGGPRGRGGQDGGHRGQGGQYGGQRGRGGQDGGQRGRGGQDGGQRGRGGQDGGQRGRGGQDGGQRGRVGSNREMGGGGQQSGGACGQGAQQVEPQRTRVTAADLERKFQESLKFTESAMQSGLVPPDKRSNGEFPGKEGKVIKIEVNHFRIKQNPNKRIYQYSIEIHAPWKREYAKKDKEIYDKVFRSWSRNCVKMGTFVNKQGVNTTLAFNGKNIFYSTQQVDDIPDMEDIEILDEDEKKRLFAVKNVKYVQPVWISQKIEEFMDRGRQAFPGNEVGFPQDEVNTLDIILNQSVRLYDTLYRTIGRNYFTINGNVLDLGFGKEVWVGTFSSVRPYGWKDAGYLMTLNVDVANKPATVACHMTNESAPNKWDSYVQRVLQNSRYLNLDKGLDDRDFRTLQEDLKGLKVRYELPDGRKRSYRIIDLVKPARQQIIPDLKITVEEYFRKELKEKLRYPLLPCLWVGSRDKTIYIPMEFCSMVAQPMPRNKRLAEDAVANMIRGTAVRPEERRRKILEGLRNNCNFYKNDEFSMEFGMSIEAQMLQVNARILSAPGIAYRPQQKTPVELQIGQPGSWRPTPFKHLYVDGKKLDNWVFMDSARVSIPEFNDLVRVFKDVGDKVGLTINTEPEYIEFDSRNLRRFDDLFEEVVKTHRPEMIMVCLGVKDSQVYDRIKTLGDNKFKVPTQCVQKRTLFKMGRVNDQSISNIFLKMNSKLGGINHSLASNSRPQILREPVMIMGADVSHAAPESKGTKPSLAAVVASCDPKASLYMTEIRVQDAGQNEEIIQDMENLTRKLLLGFLDKNKGRKPRRIIMYRDGVSEGQFLKVLANELRAIRSACSKLEQGYEPMITYVIVQKRHHTRFFPIDGNKYPKSGNVLAGTVVDKGINHPKEGDFYLVSHEGIQGTSRPTHYHVIWDDNDMSADEMEKLTYYLCHLYARCTRSVSYPAPTYYAHLAADRARKHHNDMTARRENGIKEKIEDSKIDLMYFV